MDTFARKSQGETEIGSGPPGPANNWGLNRMSFVGSPSTKSMSAQAPS